MISAHGASVEVTRSHVIVTYSPLGAALRGRDSDTYPLQATASHQAPTSIDGGWVTLDDGTTIPFSPNQQAALESFIADVDAALRGEAPSDVCGLNFVAVNVATANARWASICRIALVKVIDGKETDSRAFDIKPAGEFEDYNVEFFGLQPGDFLGSPSFNEVVPEVAEFVGDLPLVAHNAQFAMTALAEGAALSGAEVPHWRFGCSLALSRFSDLEVRNHKLETIADALGITVEQGAEGRARTVGQIVVAYAQRAGFRGSLAEFFATIGFELGATNPASVTPVTRTVLVPRTAQENRLEKAEPEEPEKGSSSSKAGKKRSAPWQAVATPDEIPEAAEDADPENPLFGEHVTLTGDFEPYDKGMLWNGIAARGGQVGKNVTKKTTVLVTGTWATKTSKEKRAEELIEKGQKIAIWPSAKLYEALGLDEEPPF